MPNIAAAFREEVTRLARKEARALTAGLRKAFANCRKEVAALKRRSSELGTHLRRLRRGADSPAAPARAIQRFRAAGLGAHRKRLGVSAADYGKLLGVSAQTVYSWERGHTRPRAAQMRAIAEVRPLGKRAASARLARVNSASGKRRPSQR